MESSRNEVNVQSQEGLYRNFDFLDAKAFVPLRRMLMCSEHEAQLRLIHAGLEFHIFRMHERSFHADRDINEIYISAYI